MSGNSESVEVLRPIDALNDYVAIVRTVELPEGIDLPEDQVKEISNEGVVVGVGPDVKGIEIGDRIIFQPKRYIAMTPQSGGYKGREVIIGRMMDCMVRLGKTTKFRFEDGDNAGDAP